MPNSTPVVSIITPCYNACSTIADTIKSVLRQSYQNWEMIIVDDCSTDKSAEIIRQFASNDSRIKYLKTEKASGSPSLPRNMGIDHASGYYVAFLDSDDLWLTNKLKLQMEFIEKNKVEIVYSYYEKIDFCGKRDNREVQTRRTTCYSELLKSNSIPCLTSVVSMKAIGSTRFKQIAQEDFCFWLDILKKGYVAYNVCEKLALYREARYSRSSNKIGMFVGYWNVIRHHQKISVIRCCLCMITYTIYGVIKYIK